MLIVVLTPHLTLNPVENLPPQVNLVPTLTLYLILKTAAAKETRLILKLVRFLVNSNHFQEIWNQEFLHRQSWLLAEAGYRGCLRDWFRASCQFIRDSGRLPFDATLQEQEDWEQLIDQFDHQAAVMVQMAIIAEERRQNVYQHAGPSGAWGPNDEEVDEMRCDSTHSHLSREQLSELPNSNSSVDTWVDEVRGKG